MKKSTPNSRIEVWGGEYINNPPRRQAGDRNVDIVQIEPSHVKDEYIVEVVACE